MSNNAPDYEDNLVFPPQDDQIVGEPEGKIKGKVTPFSEQEINNARVEAAKLIATAVGAATYELKDQLQIKDMRIRKLKQKNAKMKEVLKECYNLFTQEQCSDCGLSMSGLIEICTKIEEVLK